MDTHMDFEEMQNENQNKNNLSVKRKTHVGCWKNKKEFIQVYSWLFDEKYMNNNDATNKALKQMKIWKLRRLNLTPASILSTIVLIEVQLKDNSATKNQLDSNDADNELKIMYSSAFIRFFNYMSSIMQSKNLKSMYDIAKDLGIESFIVDLRHLCSHGQLMPEISILRNALNYCVKWLKAYYWDNELNNMIDVTSDNIRLHDLTQFDNNITNLFQLYDTALELRFKNCNMIAEAQNMISDLAYNELKKYSSMKKNELLNSLSKFIIKDISKIVKREPGLKDLSQIYIAAFLKMQFFFESAASHIEKNLDISNLIKLNQDLFQSIAIHGFIEELFFNLITLCENENEEHYKRQGCGFWANKITEGFIAFKKLKIYYKNRKENENTCTSMHTKLSKIYSKELSIDCNKTLIFSDNFRRPWSLQFNLNYIQERINKINVFTKDVVTSCLVLLNPPFTIQQLDHLTKLISIYYKKNLNDKALTSHNNEYYHIKDGHIKLGNWNETENLYDNDEHDNEKKIGIWTMTSESQNWSAYPLGRLIWE